MGLGPRSSSPLALGASTTLAMTPPTPAALAFTFHLCSVSTSQLLPVPLSLVSEEQGPPWVSPQGKATTPAPLKSLWIP